MKFDKPNRTKLARLTCWALLSPLVATAACSNREPTDEDLRVEAQAFERAAPRRPKSPVSSAKKSRVRLSKNPFAQSKWNASRDKQGARAVEVKFRDGLRMRLKGGLPYDAEGKGLSDRRTQEVFKKLGGGRWQRSILFPAKVMDDLRKQIEGKTKRSAPDMNLYFTYSVPKALALSETIALLEQLPDVQLVYALPQYEVAAVDDYRFARPNDLPYQSYLEPAEQGGMDAFAVWSVPGGQGTNIDFFDVEYGFEPGHMELAGTITDFAGLDAASAFPGVEQRRIDHGTASLGVVVGDDRGPGITGMAPAAGKHFVPVTGGAELALHFLLAEYCAQIEHPPSGCNNLTAAMLYPLVAGALSRGDVLLLEIQMAGPNAGGSITFEDQYGAVPVEYSPSNYDAIRTLTMTGVVVVEAAGNGEQNLDDAAYTVSSHQPFRMKNGVRTNDSGAVLVGAVSSGAPWSFYLPGPDSPRAPAGLVRSFSNYGGRVDVHAWGDGVVTSGYGDLYGADEPVLAYTMNYGGTSAASALVAGAVTALQGAYRADYLTHHSADFFDGHLWGPTVRDLLKRTGVQATRLADVDPDVQDNVELSNLFNLDPTANVGRRPNLGEAVKHVLLDAPSWGDPLPPPIVSAESGVLERDGSLAAIRIGFGTDVAVHRGVVDILYTTDGSAPDCSPRCGSCDTDRVKIITRPMNWRWDHTVWLDMSTAPVTVRARTHIFDCGTPYSPEVTRVYN